jgi:hypothetical protein
MAGAGCAFAVTVAKSHLMKDFVFFFFAISIQPLGSTQSFSTTRCNHSTVGSAGTCRRKSLSVESLFAQAPIQAGHYTDCICEVSLSLVTSLTTLFVSCVLRSHGLLSLATSQQKISRNCGQPTYRR